MENEENFLILASTRSTIVSLDMVRLGKAGLDDHRQSVLNRVSKQYSWAILGKETLTMIDLAYLTAKTGDEFAILSGKRDDILFHGDKLNCDFEKVTELKEMLIMHKYEIFGHSHPREPIPVASLDDKRVLRTLNQKTSRLISGMTGMCVVFDASF